MSANRSVGDIVDQVKDGNWIESSGVEHYEFAPADKVFTGRAHAQLDGLHGRVAIYATDDLLNFISSNEAQAVDCKTRTPGRVARPEANLVFMIGLSFNSDSITGAAADWTNRHCCGE